MRTRRTVLLAAIALSLFAAPALADGTFVKIGDIRGTATEAQHQGWIAVGTWGVEKRKATGFWSFMSEPKPVFWFEKRNDVSSAALQRALSSQSRFARIEFDVSIRGDILRTTLYDARITSIETRDKVERIQLQFTRQTDQRVTFTASR
jgi:type VI protein secretion system component Hcp